MPLSSLYSTIAALALVLGLVLLAARAVRATGSRFQGVHGGAGRRLAVQEAFAIDRARRLLIVQCDGRELLLLTGGPADAVIGWLPGHPALPEPRP